MIEIARGPGWEFRNCDFRDAEHGLVSIDAVHHVITDPPYGEQSHTKQRTVHGAGYEEVEELPFEPLSGAIRWKLLTGSALICAGWLLAFCELEAFGDWKRSADAHCLKWTRAGLWLRPATPQITGDRPGQAAEGIAIVWLGDGRRVWNGGGRAGLWRTGNVWREEGTPRREAAHPSQKPVVLMEQLIADFTQPGELIADPFAGSATTGVAAVRLGRRFIGWERYRGFWEAGVCRLEGTSEQMVLPVLKRAKQAKLW